MRLARQSTFAFTAVTIAFFAVAGFALLLRGDETVCDAPCSATDGFALVGLFGGVAFAAVTAISGLVWVALWLFGRRDG